MSQDLHFAPLERRYGPRRPRNSKRVDLWARLDLHGVSCTAEYAAIREDTMSVQPMRKEGDRNPRTIDTAQIEKAPSINSQFGASAPTTLLQVKTGRASLKSRADVAFRR
jgi:hypothetical protein